MFDPERRLLQLAATQGAHLSRAQAHGLGVDDDGIKWRLRTGDLRSSLPGVYRFAALPPMPDEALWIAYLAVGDEAVVSHECAAARRGFRSVPQGLLVLTAGRGTHHRIPGATVHQLLDVLPHHVEVLDGFRITTVPRTIVDCAAVVSQVRLDRLVEQAITEKRCTTNEIGGVVREIARRGKPGMAKTGRALAKFGPGKAVGDSELERLLLRALLDRGNPMPTPQFAHPGRHPGKGRVDFAYPEAKLILEADGRTWHQRIADLVRDRQRDNEAARAGWLTMRFMWEELTNDPDDVAAAVRETLAHRLAMFSRQ